MNINANKIFDVLVCFAVFLAISSWTNPFYGIIGAFAFNYGSKRTREALDEKGDEE